MSEKDLTDYYRNEATRLLLNNGPEVLPPDEKKAFHEKRKLLEKYDKSTCRSLQKVLDKLGITHPLGYKAGLALNASNCISIEDLNLMVNELKEAGFNDASINLKKLLDIAAEIRMMKRDAADRIHAHVVAAVAKAINQTEGIKPTSKIKPLGKIPKRVQNTLSAAYSDAILSSFDVSMGQYATRKKEPSSPTDPLVGGSLLTMYFTRDI